MTVLSAHPLDPDQADFIDLLADDGSMLAAVHASDFRDACRTVAERDNGWVHPSKVSAVLHERFGEINPQSFSARWAPACGPNGFLDKTDVRAPIDGTHSKNNGNKDIVLRRWRGWKESE
ncbi:hypothetical protein [Pimelobacter simplex]|uniref:hypothetical protein n=1 Tax=Nocardioides simplex TaxID=2045 RepID=UPI003AAA816C